MMRILLPFKALDKLENAEYLDDVVSLVQKVVRSVIRAGAAKDLLHGVPMGHPLHPLAVQLPIGAWTSAVVLDFVPGTQKASEVLIAVGVISAVPAVVSGLTDWVELHPQQQRVGVFHAVANATGTLLFGVSWALRSKDTGRGESSLQRRHWLRSPSAEHWAATSPTGWLREQTMQKRSRTSLPEAGKGWVS